MPPPALNRQEEARPPVPDSEDAQDPWSVLNWLVPAATCGIFVLGVLVLAILAVHYAERRQWVDFGMSVWFAICCAFVLVWFVVNVKYNNEPLAEPSDNISDETRSKWWFRAGQSPITLLIWLVCVFAMALMAIVLGVMEDWNAFFTILLAAVVSGIRLGFVLSGKKPPDLTS